MSIELASTSTAAIDLIAMRNWHFHCSVDKNRSPAMRKWHRGQVLEINKRIPRAGPGSLTLVKIGLIELLAAKARKQLHATAGGSGPFDWRRLCGEALMEIEQERTAQKERLEALSRR